MRWLKDRGLKPSRIFSAAPGDGPPGQFGALRQHLVIGQFPQTLTSRSRLLGKLRLAQLLLEGG